MFYFEENKSGCSEFGNIILDREGDPDSDFSPIVIVDRGNCTFVRKSKNVQQLGGALALIVNNEPNRDPEDVIMIDDGTGNNIVIPTILISKEDGDNLKKAIKETDQNLMPGQKREYVVLIVNFEMENPDNRVEYDIWYTSGDKNALTFIAEMHEYNKMLGDHALMTPHIMVQTCFWCSVTEMQDNCLRPKQTVYCAPPGNYHPLNGKEALRQGLNEICVYKTYKDVDNAEKWWMYMEKSFKCLDERYSATCLDQIIKDLDIDPFQIQRCLYDEDELLKSDYESIQSNEIMYNPAVVINQRIYRGILKADHIFSTICAGFNETPPECEKVLGITQTKGTVGLSTILWIVGMLIIINILLICCYRRYSRREMKDEMQLQISSMMSQYFAISDKNQSATGSQ